MLKVFLGVALTFIGSIFLTSCASKTEVVALQPQTRPVVRYSAPVTRTQSVRVKGNPKPSPWATDVVNAYDQ